MKPVMEMVVWSTFYRTRERAQNVSSIRGLAVSVGRRDSSITDSTAYVVATDRPVLINENTNGNGGGGGGVVNLLSHTRARQNIRPSAVGRSVPQIRRLFSWLPTSPYHFKTVMVVVVVWSTFFCTRERA